MTPSPLAPNDPPLEALLQGALENTLDPAAHAALSDRLLRDEPFRDAYLRMMQLHAMLQWRTAAEAPIIARARAMGFTLHRDSLTPTRIGASPRSVWYLAAALFALAAALFFVFLPSTPNSELPTPRSNAPASFAILSDVSADAQFAGADAERSLGEELTAPIRLATGRAQIMFKSAAVVDLTGPCEFTMTGPNRGKLTAGRLAAYVRPEARGFTVDLPDGARIVDLGTAFDVTIHDADGYDIQVTAGRVLLERRGAESIQLDAGRHIRLSHSTIIELNGAIDLPLVNGDFESDPAPAEGATGWTIRSTAVNSRFWTMRGAGLGKVDPVAGQGPSKNFLTANRLALQPHAPADPSPVTTTASQRLDLSPYAADIDAAGATVAVTFWYASPAVEDDAFVSVEFFDSAGASLGSTTTPQLPKTDPNRWVAGSVADAKLAVPPHTRSLAIALIAKRTKFSETNISFDNVRAVLHSPAPDAVPATHPDARQDQSSHASDPTHSTKENPK
ncbi:MAG: hypothetical protein GC162_02495 [Planctomycetes bacterium]|nr:hypothetical protein [Planctomycetota bacterium]